MNMKKILLALFIITLFLFGCAKQPVTEVPEPEEVQVPVEEVEEPSGVVPETGDVADKGSLKLLVSDQENVIADFDSIDITFSKVKVYEPKGSAPIEKDIEVVADLTELQGRNALKLLELNLDAGAYSKIKLYASSIKGTLLGNEVEVVIPYDTLTLEKYFQIKNGERTTFVFDLEVVKTGKVTTTTGLEEYNLQPVPSESGTVPTDVTLVEEVTAAVMQDKMLEKVGKKYDRHVFMTRDTGFSPSEITIEKGTKVIWENKDDKKLGITMENTFDKFLRAGGSYEHTFNRAGTYPYNMKYAVSNKGVITVVLPEEKVEEEVKPGTPRTVYIKSTGFSPSELNIKKGTKVTFINQDTQHHHFIISTEPLTEVLAQGESYVYVFNEGGEFTFYDGYDIGKYSGRVIVS